MRSNYKTVLAVVGLIAVASGLYVFVPSRFLESGWLQIGTILAAVAAIVVVSKSGEKPSREAESLGSLRLRAGSLVWVGLGLLLSSIVWLVGLAGVLSAFPDTLHLTPEASAKLVVIPFSLLGASGLSLIIYRIILKFVNR